MCCILYRLLFSSLLALPVCWLLTAFTPATVDGESETGSYGCTAAPSLPAVATAQPVSGISYFVSPNGNGNACTQNSPCSLDAALKKAGPGDEVILKNGTYNQSLIIKGGGSANNPLIIRAENTHGAIIRHSGGGRLNGNVLHSHVIVRGLVFDGNKKAQNGLRIGNYGNRGAPVTNVIAENNWIINQGGAGVKLSNARNITVRHNVIDGTGYSVHYGEGMYIGDAQVEGIVSVADVEVYGNTIRNATENGIDIKHSAQNVHVHHNIIVGLMTAVDQGASDWKIYGADRPHPNRGRKNYGVIAMSGKSSLVHDNILKRNKGGFGHLVGKGNLGNKAYRNVVMEGVADSDGGIIKSGGEYYENTFCNLKSYKITKLSSLQTHDNRVGAPVAECQKEEQRILEEMKQLPGLGAGWTARFASSECGPGDQQAGQGSQKRLKEY